MCSRIIQPKAKKLAVKLGLLGHYVNFIYIKDYFEFAQFVSNCDIYLPTTDPRTRRAFYPAGVRRLTGSIPQIVAYNLSSVMHESLHNIYRKYLNSVPVEVYNDEVGSDVDALTRMMTRIVDKKH
mmetsp:Transcript_6753/g.12707  ORF Transcript_6753/g.12707 Transcript_6753/m.12707 type:complete len:125 (-) Transcript_6753:35-409(-)